MSLDGVRIILDTNTILRGIAKPQSASGRLVDAAEERRVLLLTSRRVMDEYRIILFDQTIMKRYLQVSPRTVELTLRSLAYFSESIDDGRTRYAFSRDPKDEKFLVLAIAGRATHLITFDNDLLSLSISHDDAAKRLRQRLPKLRIQTPGDFLTEHSSDFPRI